MPITFLDEEEDIAPLATPAKRKITFLDEEEDITPLAQPTKRKITFLDEEDDIAPVTPQATQPAVTQPSPYKYDPARFRPRGLTAPKAEEKPEEQGILRQVADIPLGIARGGVTGIKMMTDILGADNAVSKSLSGVEGYMADLMSAQAKEDQQEISRIMKDAEDKGFGEQVKAAIKSFSIAPVDIMSQALGTMAPVIATGLVGSAAKLGAMGVRGVQLGLGAAMGAGETKGEIYNEVKNELVNSGVAEDVAEKSAVEAQSYGGKNLDLILLNAGLGAASTLGAEGIITRILTKQGTAPAAGIVSRVLKGGLSEAGPEAGQEAGIQLSKNVALQREGFDVDPSRGVVTAATMGAIAGAPLGGIAGAVEKPAPIKTLAEENLEQTNEIARKVAENGAPLTASAIQDQAATNLRQDELAKELEAQLEEELVAVKEPTAAAPKPMSKDEFKAIYSQVAPEELDAAEAGFAEQAATAETEEGRINAQNALEAIKEVKATVAPPAPTVEPAITPAVTPAVPTAQPTITDATQEIIQPEGVRQEPQDGTQVQPTEEAGVGDSILGAARGEEEGQVVPTTQPTISEIPPTSELVGEQPAEPIISEIPPTSELVGAEPTQPTIREVPEISPIVGAEPAAIVEQEPVAPAEPAPIRKYDIDSPEVRQGVEESNSVQFLNRKLARVESEAVAAEDAYGIALSNLQQSDKRIPNYSDYVRAEKRAKSARDSARKEADKVRVDLDEERIRKAPFVRLALNTAATEAAIQPTTAEPPSPAPVTTPPVTEAVTPAEAPAITPAPVAETPTVTEAPAAEVAPASWIAPEQKLTPQESRALQVANLRGTEKRTGNITFVPEKLMTPQRLQSLRTEQESSGTLKRFPKGGKFIEIKMMGDVTGDPYAKGWAIIDRRPDLNRREWIAQIPSRDERILAGSIANNESEKIVSAIKEGSITQERSNQLVDEAANNQIISSDFANNLKTAISNSTPAVSETITPAAEPAGISVGSKVKYGTLIKPYIVEEVIPQTAREIEEGDQFYRIRSEQPDKNGKYDIANVEKKDIKPILGKGKGKGARKIAAATRNEEYMRLAQNPEANREQLQRMVDEAAKNAGYGANQYSKADFDAWAKTVGDLDQAERIAINNSISASKAIDNPNLSAVMKKVAKSSLERYERKAQDIQERKRKGLPPKRLVRGDNRADITVYRGATGRSIWATDSEDVAKTYGDNLRGFFLQMQNPLIIDAEGVSFRGLSFEGSRLDADDLSDIAKERGYDGLIIRNFYDSNTDDGGEVIADHFTIFNPEQIKSADPVTYDNAGNIIPLEERFQPTSPDIRRQAIDTTPEGILTTPPDQQYTFNEVFDVAYDMFGGEIPEGFTIVNDSTDKDFEFKAAYIPESGEIIVNLAYLNKSDDIRDTITHELGHYIFGDPEFRAAFDQFIASLSPEARADLDAYVETAYNKETGEIRLEEKMVRAFVDQFISEEQAPAWRSMLDAIKRFLNKLGFKFNISDRDAISVFTAALDRYKAGEAISREGGARKIIDDLTAMDAEYLAAVERGDMETAQRMVDEAAETAGYSRSNAFDYDTDNYFPWFHGSPEGGITVFKNRFDEYYFSNDRDTANSFGDAVYESYLKMSNPLIADAFGGDKYSVTFEGEKMSVDDFVQIAKTKGHDSAIIENVVDSVGGVTDPSTIVAVFNPTQIKSADPVTYDDAGDVIPLSQRFRPTSPDIRRMAAEPRREQVAGMKIGRIITTPPGITQKTTDIIRNKFFDSTKVSPENTSQAWAYISQFMDKTDNNNNKFAGYVNQVTEEELAPEFRKGVEESMGASLFSVELANYAGRLAVQGDTKMLAYMIRNGNKMPTGEFASGVSQSGRVLNAFKKRLSSDISGVAAYETELESNVERLAAVLFGTNTPSKEQIKIAQDALTQSETIELGDANQVAADIKEVEGRTKTNLIDKVDAKISQAIDKSGRIKELEGKATRPRNIDAQAESVIESLQRSLGELPPLPQRRESDIRTIVKQDLRQNPDMGRREPWNNMLVGRLMQAGVSEEQAQTIADLTWKQHEQKAINRELKEMRKAAEEGSLAVIIDRIKNTSLEKQQSPEWKQDVIKEYLRDAGLSSQAAETAAKLYDSVISERIAAAKQKAFEDTLAKAAPWNNYASRNGKLAKDALKKIKEAIRTGVLDPEKNTESIIAALSGWTGFTKEQYQRIVELDTILNDPNQDDITKREAMFELNKIITKAKMPVRFKDALGAYYIGNALMGIPTALVNIVSPISFSIRNLMVDIAKYTKDNPAKIPVAFETFLDSMRSWYNQTSYAFKNQIYLNDVVEYLNGQNVLRETFDKGKKQWAEGKYAEGFANMAVGMTQITGRVLSALDQGAISMLENQNITRYAMAALENAKKKVPKDKIVEFANMTLDLKRRVIIENIAAGMDADRAGVLADLAVKSELRAALSEYEADTQSVLDSAINDALQSVGRNKVITIEGIERQQKDVSDSGILSYWPIKMLEKVSEGAGKEGSGMQIFSKMVYGFALVPARTFHTAAWFSPYGFLRLAIDKYKTNKGQESPYAMSLQTEAQYRQRLTESIAGSIAMLGLFALRSGSSDEDEDKKFKIVITGNGPNAVTDKQYYDSWIKKYKPYSINIVLGDTVIPINIGRGGEALFFPIMLAGALDDYEIKSKQNLTKKEPDDLNAATEMLGSAFFALAQRGPYAAFTEPLFDASKQGRVTENLVSQLGYFGKTFVPVLGASITRNISDIINDPVDRSSIEGAIYANTPIVGPWIGTKALNALGQPIRADDWGDKLYKLGVPVVFSFPKNTPENALNELILKQGSGPTLPTRANAQKRFGDVLTSKEFETYVREYGRVMSDKMFKNRTRLANMKSSDYDDELEKYARGYSIDGIKIKGASDSAVLAVKRMRQ